MTTFRLGSSCSAEKCTNVSVRRWEEEGDVEDVADPDRLLQCPYDKNHQIRACRFPYHLIKCQKNHPKLAQELKTCPFNARHLMPKHELSHHIANCVDRSSVNTEDLGSSEVRSKWHVPVNTWENPKCSEDWDKEIEESPGTTFIWGVSTSKLNQESSRAETRTTNSLPPGLRAPTTLPWKNSMGVQWAGPVMQATAAKHCCQYELGVIGYGRAGLSYKWPLPGTSLLLGLTFCGRWAHQL
ncbi:hypothetical protein COCON_G00146520 [Conger conger]|uniref:CHHC U11-48K-type domain-containing protein n=1 Tax=Conger conger TaxID=82655 RepID=A0A9Q1DBS0_CONCO|nr:hypothetical protein COCON_G00146520 [Conger conger]